MWQKGRQKGVIYFKKLLFKFKLGKIGMDCYLLKYPPHTSLPRHKDEVKGGKHWRFNLSLKGSSTFYLFTKRGLKKYKYFCLFRPDIQEHWVQSYEKGCLKLSIGLAKFTENVA